MTAELKLIKTILGKTLQDRLRNEDLTVKSQIQNKTSKVKGQVLE